MIQKRIIKTRGGKEFEKYLLLLVPAKAVIVLITKILQVGANLQGEVLWKSQKLTGNYVNVPLSGFAVGIYMVIVIDQVHTGTLKLMKQ